MSKNCNAERCNSGGVGLSTITNFDFATGTIESDGKYAYEKVCYILANVELNVNLNRLNC